MGFDVDVRIVGHVEDDLDDPPAGERERRLVLTLTASPPS
jgi:hypothetical protein